MKHRGSLESERETATLLPFSLLGAAESFEGGQEEEKLNFYLLNVTVSSKAFLSRIPSAYRPKITFIRLLIFPYKEISRIGKKEK